MGSEDYDNKEFDVSRNIMLAVIASLFVVVMIIVLLQLYTGLTSMTSPQSARSVCLGTITEDSTVGLLPICKHMLHVECIDTWLGSHTTSPICRTEAESTVQALEDKELCSGFQSTAPPIMESASIGAAEVRKEGGSSGYLVPLEDDLLLVQFSCFYNFVSCEVFVFFLLAYQNQWKNYDAAVVDITISATRADHVQFTQPDATSGLSVIIPATSEDSTWIFLKPPQKCGRSRRSS
ncbi:cyclic nucleotide-gated channel [Hibiscus syriacus]|uniref:Cyclic nucleotide-gated channel n=1 Tax=Hibiscus syriacus TaxID=106335 RepID=A0A6A3ASC9_HIBSY|nr:cyclic nucleotide-gated channel [Hibiscus syriacus]